MSWARRRWLTRVLAAATAGAMGLVGLVALEPGPAEASFSTWVSPDGTSGRFRDLIDWFEWGDTKGQVVKAGTVTNERDAGDTKIQTACTISNIKTSGKTTNPLVVKQPGSWRGDGFDNLYNIGGTDANNKMLAGISNATDGETVSFSVSCKMTVIPKDLSIASVEVDLPGLVIADAEASGGDEYVQATPGQGFQRWRIIDRYRGEKCSESTMADLTDTTLILKSSKSECEAQLQTDGTYAGGGPTAVAFMEGATSADVQLFGYGMSAVAIGVVSSIDWADASQSYGAAGVLNLPPWTGGELKQGSNNVFAESFKLADVGSPSVRLGELVDGEPAQLYSATATGDDNNNLDDEDLAIPGTITGFRGGMVTLNDLKCVGDGQIWGWIDFNQSGVFEMDTEMGGPAPAGGQPFGSGPVPCADAPDKAATFSLTWPVPANAKAQPVGKTAIVRVGITTDPRAEARLLDIAITGELEDHAVDFLLDPYVIEKTSTATEDSRVGDVLTYSITVTTPTSTNIATTPATIVVKDDLSGVLDDADWLGQTSADGVFSLDSATGELTWTGAPPAAGASKTLTYKVQINGAATGDRELKNVAWVDNPASSATPTCDIGLPSGRDPITDEPCASLDSETPSLSLLKTSTGATGKRSGEEITYTVTATNQGPGAFTASAPATVWDDLADVLDDADLVSVSVDRGGGVLDSTANSTDP
ncbi:MAG: CshA/CshB family fibrillar adhesin-related protein, partial [Bifidobacteriaceae bacterium]|nr:CshA/CshB family fibrillar adhesin-related protein [Bifidobacteriaceae bacterium]